MSIEHEHGGMSTISGLTIARLTGWFEDRLAENGVRLQANSPLHQALEANRFLERAFRGEVAPPESDADFTMVVRQALGILFQLKALHRAWPKLHGLLKPRLAALAGRDANLLIDAPQSTERDMVFETLMACLCSEFSQVLGFDEPDVLISWNGAKWGIACKILYSTKLSAHKDRIVEGAKQIETAACDYGLVAVHLANQINHGVFWGEHPSQPGNLKSFRDPGKPIEVLADMTTGYIKSIDGASLHKRLTEDKSGAPRNKCRGVAFFAQTLTAVRRVLTPLALLNFHRFRHIEGPEFALARSINHAVQTVITYTPAE